MTYATTPIATDLGIREPLTAVLRHAVAAVAAVQAAIARANERKGYRQMLQRDDAYLQDIGVTREQVRKALADL